MCAADPAAGVTVTCNKTEAGGDWPDRPFTVTVNATGGPAGCKSSDEDSAAITVDPKPSLTVTPPSNTTICSTESSTGGLRFNVRTSVATSVAGSVTLDATNAGLSCRFTPAGTLTTGKVEACSGLEPYVCEHVDIQCMPQIDIHSQTQPVGLTLACKSDMAHKNVATTVLDTLGSLSTMGA
jgi:hypothetical protein